MVKLSEIQVNEEQETAPEEDFTEEVPIDHEFLKKQNIFFATPCYGGMITDQYFLSMFKTTQALSQIPCSFRLTTLRNESLVTRARNILTAMFLESDASHLFFLDADIEWEPEAIMRAISADKDIVASAYPKKALPIQYALNFKFIDPVNKRIRFENGLVEVLDASTGFFCIKRQVFERMMLEYPELHYKNDSNIDEKIAKYCYAFFDTHIDEEDRRYLSEDYRFCRLWQKLGGEIWLDPKTKLNHIGTYTFEGNVDNIISVHGP
tara:strand:- start:1891 stop:2685 length:795 start_codon:yes stop_codon:yes gene_type:complete